MLKTGIYTTFLSGIAAIAATSCATIVSGTKQRIRVVTTQPGAEVWVDDEFRDSTPCVVKIKRTWDDPSRIRVSKSGYKEENIELKKKMNEVIILNFVNIFGWALDGATGACIKYEQPDTIQLTQRKKSP